MGREAIRQCADLFAIDGFDERMVRGWHVDANIAKLLASEAAWEAAEACMQTHGGFGYAREYHVERRWREARIQRIAPVSTNLILSYIGEHVLGMPRSF